MHNAQKLAFGLLAAAAVASASDVTQLKKDTFDDFVKTNDIVLAECKLQQSASRANTTLTRRSLQSSLPGAVTARHLPQSTRRRQHN